MASVSITISYNPQKAETYNNDKPTQNTYDTDE